MGKLFQNKGFDLGFLSGVITFGFVNYLSYLLNRTSNFTCDDCGYRFGFPFYFKEYGGFISADELILFGLIADIFVGLIFSFVIGLIFNCVWKKFTIKKLR